MKIKIRNADGNSSDEADDATHDSCDLTFRWTPESTKLMLDLRFGRNALFQQRHHQKKKLWTDIAEEMGRQGFMNVTSEMCDLKYRNMLQTYKKNRLKDEQGLQSAIVWDYYELFKRSFRNMADEAATVPSMLCESLCEEANAEHHLVDDAAMQPAKDCVKIEIINDEDREASATECEQSLIGYKNRSLPQRRSMRVPKRPRRFSTLSTQTVRIDLSTNEDGNVSSQTEQGLEANTSVNMSTQTINHLSRQTEKPESLAPTWLTTSELQECRIFGESIGAQLAQVKELKTRALLQLKMQELLFKAKIGVLSVDQDR